MTIEELRKKGWIAFEYIRGSKAYGTNIETSDEDHGGVFICPPEYLLGLRSEYIEQVSDEKCDTVFYEFGRWIELLLKSNPTALESIFIPKDCIIGKVHPAVQYVINHRNAFLSKECFKTLTGYAVSQIGKARGLNKKIVNPVEVRKSPLDFCTVPYLQGVIELETWLEKKGLKQKYCGLVKLPKSHDGYGLYYDWGTHMICEYGADLQNYTNITEVCQKMPHNFESTFFEYMENTYGLHDDGRMTWTEAVSNYLEMVEPFGFRGIVSESCNSDSLRVVESLQDEINAEDVNLETIPKYILPLTTMFYNKDGFETHCQDYIDYQHWKKNRNPVRYENNLGHNYDSKNLMHCMRLTRMGKELALGQGFNVRRKDREFLLSIRNHEMDYDEIMAMAEKEKAEMDRAIPSCNLPDTPDIKKINKILIKSREKVYKQKQSIFDKIKSLF